MATKKPTASKPKEDAEGRVLTRHAAGFCVSDDAELTDLIYVTASAAYRLVSTKNGTDQATKGIDKRIVIHDADVKNREQCEFVARRIVAEERRAGWHLEYTVAGHTIDGVTWGPDTIVQVDDEELGIDGLHYLEACTHSRSNSGTTTKLTLMRPSDLLFATGLDAKDGAILKRKLKVPQGKTVR